MGDKAVISSSAEMTRTATAAVKKTAADKSKKLRTKPTHPKTSEMVNAAIASLKERGGSSLQAIKKYIAGTYKVDGEKFSPFVKKYLRAAVTAGILVQTKGKGAAGSFKLATSKSHAAKPKVRAVTGKPVTPKKAAVKKSPVAKKASAKKSKAVGEKRKVGKGPAAKPPKAKTTKAKIVGKSTPKKAAPVKRAASAVSKSKRTSPKKTNAIRRK